MTAPLLDQPVAQLLPGCPAGTSHGARVGANLPEPEFYDFPWGRRMLAVCEHEHTIGGDGYGDRCCGTMDVPTLNEAHDGCARRLCERCCDDTCCRTCHAASVENDEENCRACEPRHCYGYSRCNDDDTSTCECQCAQCDAARAV